MIPQVASDRWYYAKDKKKVGPVSLARLRELLADGVVTATDMVLQEGTQKWRPVAEIASSAAGNAPIGKLWPWALAGVGGVVLVALALGGCGLAAMLFGPGAGKTSEKPTPVVEAPSGPGQGNATDLESAKQPTANPLPEPMPPAPLAQADDHPKAESPVSSKERPVLVLQMGHIDGITAVAFSSDGTKVLTGSVDKTARLWHVDSGREIRAFAGHTDRVTSVAFSPDGKQVLTGSNDKTARLWDAGNGKLLRELRHGWFVRAVAFSPNGKQIVTGCEDSTARLWNANSGTQIRAFIGHRGAVTAVALSADGTRLFTGAAFTGEVDKGSGTAWTARLWDTGNGRLLRGFKVMSTFMLAPAGKGIVPGVGRVAPHEGPVHAVAISPDSKYVLAADTVWEGATGREVYKLQGLKDEVGAAAFSPDGTQILTAADTTCLWDAATGKKIHTLGEVNLLRVSYSPDGKKAIELAKGSWRKQGRAMAAAFSPDGKLVLTGNTEDTAARLWDAASGQEVRAVAGMLAPVNSVAFAANGQQLLTGSADKTARLRDVVSGKVIHTLAHADFVTAVAISPDGKLLATGSGRPGRRFGAENRADLWDAVSGKRINVLGHNTQVTAVAFSSEGRQLLTAGSGDDPLQLWNVFGHARKPAFGGKVSSKKALNVGISAWALSADGKRALVAKGHVNYNTWLARDVELWDRDRGTPIQTFKRPPVDHGFAVLAMAIAADGKQILTAAGDWIRLWDVASGQQISAFKAHDKGPKSPVETLAFSPDGKQILAGSADKMARLWNAAGGDPIHVFAGHADRVTCAAFSADGTRVLTGSADGTARLWNAVSGRELCRLLGFRDGTWAVVTPDNYYMAPKGALDGMTFRVGKQLFSFDQFDLKFNRPDKVLESIGLASTEMIATYRHAYQKRLKRMNFTEDMLAGGLDLPEVAVTADARLNTRDKMLKLKIQAADSRCLLDRLHVDVNGVPVNGAGGISLRKASAKTWSQAIDVELSAGKNKIEVSVLNEKGAESLKETISIHYDTPATKPNLYVVAVGVSDYEDDRFRLTYAHKDADDLADLFESKRDRFGEVKVQRILNRKATRKNILKAKDFLATSRVDDLVVVFFAGHGLLDSKLDYYFATADIDFKNPAKRGLAYEAIEDLLDGIRARKKLLLMDTCHSGEPDKEAVQVVQSESEKKSGDEVKVRTFRGLDIEVSSKVGLNNSYQLLQEMFADLRRGTGAVVISSAGGAEFAMESATWKNGVFTHALIRGLKGEANRNKSGRVPVSELRDFVEREVRRLTHGRQVPTARRENLVVDFTLD
jgi:WD40 repeat protein